MRGEDVVEREQDKECSVGAREYRRWEAELQSRIIAILNKDEVSGYHKSRHRKRYKG